MNELIFFSHLAIVTVFTIASLKLGRGALVAAVCLQAVLANLFVLKQITLFGLHVTSCEVYTIGALLGINLLQEYYPDTDVKRVLFSYFGTLTFFLVMAQFHLHYSPTRVSATDLAYEEVLASTLRLFLASITASIVTTFLDIRLFAALKKRFPSIPLALRIGSSALIIQLLDTFIFTFLGLWGLVNYLWEVLFFSYLIKVITISSMSLLVGFVKRLPLLRDA